MRTISIQFAIIGSLMVINPVKSQSCTVKDRRTNRNVPCEFPFKFEGETHYGCINYIEVKNGRKVPGKPWCSTKVSGSQREHVKGGRHFGNCDDSCPDAKEGLRIHQQSQKNQVLLLLVKILAFGSLMPILGNVESEIQSQILLVDVRPKLENTHGWHFLVTIHLMLLEMNYFMCAEDH